MTTTNKSDSVSGNMRCKLQQLVDEHSLSVVADKTNTPVSSLHRYVRGGRIPATFVESLIDGLNISPTWFLRGEGPMYLTDVDSKSESRVAEFKSIVGAMTAASKAKLGTLHKRKGLKVLRELADTADTHRKYKRELEKKLHPIAKEWMDEFRRALDQRNLNRAHDLFNQVSKLLDFTDDAKLRLEFNRHRALYAYVDGRHNEAVELQRQNLQTRIAQSNTVDDGTLREVYNLTVAMIGLGKMKEARNFVEAMLILRGRDKADNNASLMVQAAQGIIEVSLGNVSLGIQLASHAYTTCDKRNSIQLSSLFGMVMMRTGTLSPMSVLENCQLSPPLAKEALYNANVYEDTKTLQQILAHINTLQIVDPSSLPALQAKYILATLKGRKRRPTEQAFERATSRVGPGHIQAEVLKCQRMRLDGDHRFAKHTAESDAQIQQLPKDVLPDLLVYLTHARNVLAVEGSKLIEEKERINTELDKMASSGIGLIKEIRP